MYYNSYFMSEEIETQILKCPMVTQNCQDEDKNKYQVSCLLGQCFYLITY